VPLGEAGEPQQLTVIEKQVDGDVDLRPIMPVVFTMLEVSS
jgi:hypothetical protein